MNQPITLSLEQEFSLRTFADQVQQMSREQAQEFLLMLYKQMIIRETTYRELLKHEWELDSDPIFG
ncbi:NblA/ycf18 family protein [Nostoc sp.]|uniref:NblA/ycf18 family protein n=1 Tax=Nostoc sp. TaxID=1180 RepID=UPI003593FC39